MVKVILVKGTSLISRAIKKVTNSEYSHCGLVFGNMTIEADYGGVQSRDLRTYPWPYDVYTVSGMTEQKSALVYYWAEKQIGKPYDYGKVIGLCFELLFHYSRIRSLLDSKNAFCCSEFICDALAVAGIKLVPGEEVSTPASISLDPSLHREEV
jgi:hypothetical protein